MNNRDLTHEYKKIIKQKSDLNREVGKAQKFA